MSTDSQQPKMKPTLGLTGLTMNAMALIAPGAFLWLTYFLQANYGAPMAGSDMWFGIVAALSLCIATAISYAELSKLYPGAGSSYYFAEQAFLSHTHYFKFARIFKFMVGWASHLYYWVYPGVMVAVTAIVAGYFIGTLMPDTFNANTPSPLFMILFCVFFGFGVAYIAFRGVNGATAVNIAINIIQISALLIFSVIAVGYRMSHQPNPAKYPDGVPAFALEDGGAVTQTKHMIDKPKVENGALVLGDDKKPVTESVQGNKIKQQPKVTDGKPEVDKDGKAVMEDVQQPLVVDGKAIVGPDGKPVMVGVEEVDKDGKPIPATDPVLLDWSNPVELVALDPAKPNEKVPVRQFFANPADVVKPHSFNYIIIQACIAILILVGFESVSSMGEEAKNPKSHIPKAIILSLLIQGMFCYLIEYFAANYMLNSGYEMNRDAAKSAAPIGDMMILAGTWLFGSPTAGKWFMMVEAVTVLLALVGTTLSCMNTGARVTYAMGRDEEVPAHFGMLHGRTLSPHRAIWTLAVLSVIIGIIGVYWNFCGSSAAVADSDIANLPKNVWYSFGLFKHDTAAALPQSSLVITLVSNFGTFMLYMLTCVVAIVAFREHHSFNGFKHVVIPVFGLMANLLCMLFYLIGPFTVSGMSWKESYIALGVAAVWGIYGYWYFVSSSKKKGRTTLVGIDAVNAAKKAAEAGAVS